MEYVSRALDLSKTLKKKSCFLFGARQTGKSSLIRHCFAKAPFYNLLDSRELLRLSQSPQRLREELSPDCKLVIIDEIQKLPSLLNEVHLLIEERKIRFLLTGSSARSLRRSGVNLLGGRARSRHLHPFSFCELGKKFNLLQALNHGLLPSIYDSDAPEEDLKSYAADYLQQEVAQEGLTRNIPAFSRFLEVAALCNGQQINYTEIGNDAQVPRSTVREYFQILKDTLIGFELPAWKKSKTRKAMSTSKFYFFDVGVAGCLQHRGRVHQASRQFGEAFEHYLFHELKSFVDYTQSGELAYWRSTSQFEVDFILSDEVAIEVKAKTNVSPRDLKGLKALKEEKRLAQYFLVCLEDRPRRVEGIQILPWQDFLKRLWTRQLL